jgi:FkbM family methyltransferase
MKILYGVVNNAIDVTDICLKKLQFGNVITIPSSDHDRSHVFSDPMFGTQKIIMIRQSPDNYMIEYPVNFIIKIDLLNNKIETTNIIDINNKLQNYQNKLLLNHGSFQEELPEQKLAVMYLTGNEKILEIGSNIGRNTLIIDSILKEKNNTNFVTLESDKNIAKQLSENIVLNKSNVKVEPSALSKRKLIQRGWTTIESDILFQDYHWVNTITLDDLKKKYKIQFDTLILDCEGAFYLILLDTPEILNNINLIIMENDYFDHNKKDTVDQILIKNNFYIDYAEMHPDRNIKMNNFYEVWKRTS